MNSVSITSNFYTAGTCPLMMLWGPRLTICVCGHDLAPRARTYMYIFMYTTLIMIDRYRE